jgi:nucleoredoxin
MSADFDFTTLFGETLRGKAGEVNTNAALRGKEVGIYFSAHWCPPCRSFTPVFSKWYQEKKKKGEHFEVVFVSSDRDDAEFKSYYNEMPWLALPFDRRDRKNNVASKFNVSGIPKLVILNPDGTIKTEDGRSVVTGGKEGGGGGFSLMQLVTIAIVAIYLYNTFFNKPSNSSI